MPEGVGALDHLYPLMMGGKLEAELDERVNLILPPIDASRVPTSRTPGFPPYMHYPLMPPEFHQLIVPSLAADVQDAAMLDWRDALHPVDAGMAKALDRAEKATLRDDTATSGMAGVRFDPIYALLIYLAVGLGTITLAATTRYVILWSLLLVAGLVLSVLDRDIEPVQSTDLIWGVGLGLVFSLPFLVLNWTGLSNTAIMQYPFEAWETRFLALVIVAPLADNLFFRGILQEERGFAISVASVGISAVLVFWPALYQHPVNFIVAVLVATVFAAICSFLRASISMSAAIACQVILNMAIFFIPTLF